MVPAGEAVLSRSACQGMPISPHDPYCPGSAARRGTRTDLEHYEEGFVPGSFDVCGSIQTDNSQGTLRQAREALQRRRRIQGHRDVAKSPRQVLASAITRDGTAHDRKATATVKIGRAGSRDLRIESKIRKGESCPRNSIS